MSDFLPNNLGLKISNTANPPQAKEGIFDLSTNTGDGYFSLSVPLNAPAGSYYAYAYIKEKTGVWIPDVPSALWSNAFLVVP